MSGISLFVSAACAMMATGGEWPDLSSEQKAVGGSGSDAAVVVAIEKYPFLPEVAGAAEVGISWYKYLSDTRGMSSVKLLINNEATSINILDAARDASSTVGKKGRVWFIFIGHGAPSKDGDDAVLVGVTAMGDEKNFFPNSLLRSDLLRALTQGSAEPPILILDACFSGSDASGKSLITGAQFVVNSNIQNIADFRATMLTAGRSYDIAGQLPGKSVPAFSYLVLGAMRGWGDDNADGLVTAEEAVSYATKVIVDLAPGRMQRPQLAGVNQSLTPRLSSRVKEIGPSLSDIRIKLTQKGSNSPEDRGHVSGSKSDERLSAIERARQAQREADRLMKEAQLQYAAEIDRSWDRIKRIAIGREEDGIDAITAFILEYAKGDFKNHREAEAMDALNRLKLALANRKDVYRPKAADKTKDRAVGVIVEKNSAVNTGGTERKDVGGAGKLVAMHRGTEVVGGSSDNFDINSIESKSEYGESVFNEWWFWTAIGIGAAAIGGVVWYVTDTPGANSGTYDVVLRPIR